MLNTTHLQTFVTVVDTGNYSAAARKLHMTQPAVSQHIRIIEQQLGDVRLFRRVGRSMLLTGVGQELLTATRELITMADQVEERIRSLRGQVAGRVAIGRSPAIGEQPITSVLALFHAAYPLVTISLVVASSELLLDLLARQQIDLAILDEQQRRRGLFSQLLGRISLDVVAAHDHPLLAGQQVVPGMLRDYPLVLPFSTSPLRHSIEEALRRRSETTPALQVVLETDDPLTALHAARNGMGLAFVPSNLLTPQTNGVERLVVQGLQLTQEWHLVRSRDHEAPRALRELITLLGDPQGLQLLNYDGFEVAERQA